MKKLFRMLGRNKALFFVTSLVGVLYCLVSIVVPNISGDLINSVVYSGSGLSGKVLLSYLGFCGMQILLSTLNDYLVEHFKLRQKYWMRKNMMEAVTRKPAASREEVSRYTSFISNDIPAITEQYFYGIISILNCLMMLLVSALSIFRIHWIFALVIIGVSLLILLFPRFLQDKQRSLRKNLSEAMQQYHIGLNSAFNGIKWIYAYSYHKRINEGLDDESQAIANSEAKIANRGNLIYGITGFLQIFKTAAILVAGVALISMEKINVGDLTVVLQLAGLLASPIEVLASLLHWQKEAVPLVEEYYALCFPDGGHGGAAYTAPEGSCLELEDVSYRVEDMDILQHISVRFEPGKKYLITGASGSGKSTLLRVISGVDAQGYTGNVRFGGACVTGIDPELLHSKVSPVFQDVYLFHETLEENILLGRNIPRQRLDSVLNKLNLGYLIARCGGKPFSPEMVDELSGGEKQRIALARAMVGAPEVYLLDEITSALDLENARQIEAVLLDEPATVVHISHKPDASLLNRYDAHFVMERGHLRPDTP